jgi:Flp pilus assembly protein TadB
MAGLLAPSLLSVVLLLAGLGTFAAFLVVIGLAVGTVAWLLPTQEARELAVKARKEFRTNLEFFLTLVAGERRARGSVEQALEEVSEISDSMPFVAMRRAIRRAMLSGQKPWRDLRALGDELKVTELRNLADIAEVAADGAAVYNTLLATARTLRHAELSDARTEANEVSERMSRPLALLVFGLTAFVLVPFALRMFGAA